MFCCNDIRRSFLFGQNKADVENGTTVHLGAVDLFAFSFEGLELVILIAGTYADT